MSSGMPPSPGISRGRWTTAAGVTQSLGAALLSPRPQSIPGRGNTRRRHRGSSWYGTSSCLEEVPLLSTLFYLRYCQLSKMRMRYSKIPTIHTAIKQNEEKKKRKTGQNRPASFQQIEVTLFFLPLFLGEKTKQNITYRS